MMCRTGDQLRQYLKQYFFPTVNDTLIENILAAYPDDPALGSPFDTGSNNSITPEFKRVAAILGDYVFQAPRRLLLTARSGKSSAYSFRTCRSRARAIAADMWRSE